MNKQAIIKGSIIVCLISVIIIYFVYYFDYLKQGDVIDKEFVPEHWETVLINECETNFDGEVECELVPDEILVPDEWFITIEGFGVRFEKKMIERIKVSKHIHDFYKIGDRFIK